MKKLYMIAGISLVLGIMLMISGLAMGAQRSIYMDMTGVHIRDRNESSRTIKELDLKPFTQIDINVISYDIEFIDSKKFGFEMQDNGQAKIEWSADNKILKISESIDTKHFRFFNLDFDFLWGLQVPRVIKVYVPQSTQFTDIQIKDVSGNMLLSNIDSKKLSLDMISGDVDITGSKIDSFTAKRASGNLKMDQCRLGSGNINVISGDTEISGSASNGIYIKSTSGKVDLRGDFLGNMDIYSISGNVKMVLKGAREDYSRDIAITSGTFYINDVKEKDYMFEGASQNNLKIKSVSGNVKLYFEK